MPSRFALPDPPTRFDPPAREQQYHVRPSEVGTAWVVFVGAAKADAVTAPQPAEPAAAPRVEPAAAVRVAAPVAQVATERGFFAPVAHLPSGVQVDPVEAASARPAIPPPDGPFARLTAGSVAPAGGFLPSDDLLPEAAPRFPEWDAAPQAEVAPPPFAVGPVEGESSAALILRRLGAEVAAIGDGFARVLDFVTSPEDADDGVGYAWYAGGALLTAWAGYALWENRNARRTPGVRHERRIG